MFQIDPQDGPTLARSAGRGDRNRDWLAMKKSLASHASRADGTLSDDGKINFHTSRK
jgi:hypothetical protein